jgi:hypothetical protein
MEFAMPTNYFSSNPKYKTEASARNGFVNTLNKILKQDNPQSDIIALAHHHKQPFFIIIMLNDTVNNKRSRKKG